MKNVIFLWYFLKHLSHAYRFLLLAKNSLLDCKKFVFLFIYFMVSFYFLTKNVGFPFYTRDVKVLFKINLSQTG